MDKTPQISLTDTPLYRLTDALSRWFLVSILWLVCSLPLVTVGASTKATLMVFGSGEGDDSIGRRFFRGFRTGFFRITGLWLAGGVLEALLWLDALFYRQIFGNDSGILTGMVMIIGFFLLNFFRFICYCAGNTGGSVVALFKKAVWTMLICLPAVGIMAAMDLVAVTALVRIPGLLFLIILLPGFFADMHSRLISSFVARAVDGQ